MANFFAVRSEIAQKLAEVTGLKKIYTPNNSVNVTQMSQITPAAHVNFVRISPSDSAGNGKVNMLAKQWSVTVACRNAQSQQDDISAVADEAGSFLQEIIELLSGWQPPSSSRPLSLVAVRDGYGPAFVYLTAIFESKEFI